MPNDTSDTQMHHVPAAEINHDNQPHRQENQLPKTDIQTRNQNALKAQSHPNVASHGSAVPNSSVQSHEFNVQNPKEVASVSGSAHVATKQHTDIQIPYVGDQNARHDFVSVFPKVVHRANEHAIASHSAVRHNDAPVSQAYAETQEASLEQAANNANQPVQQVFDIADISDIPAAPGQQNSKSNGANANSEDIAQVLEDCSEAAPSDTS